MTMKDSCENEGSLSMLKIISLAMTMKVRRENEDSLKHKQYTNTLHHITELQGNDSHQNIGDAIAYNIMYICRYCDMKNIPPPWSIIL